MNSGKGKSSIRQSNELGSRDRLILEDVIRFRLVTNDWLHTRYMPDAKLNAVIKISGRLCREGWLTPHKLFQRRQYFTPGQRLVRQRGLPLAKTRPLGPQALALHFAVLRYCGSPGAGTPEIQIATRDEVTRSFPWMPESIVGRPQVLIGFNADVQWRLLRIDMGGRPDHVARKISRDVKMLSEHEPFLQLLGQGRFTQVVLCPSTMKKRLIEQSLSERTWPRGIKFQIGFIPELFQLLAST